MHGKVTDQEWEIFKEAYQFFAEFCDPPANQDEACQEWWAASAKAVGALDSKWSEYPLMRSLLLAIYEYIDHKAKEKTKEIFEFVL